MNLIINDRNNRIYNYSKYVTFKAKLPKDVVRKTLTDDDFITKNTKITVAEFKKVFLDTTSSLREKSKMLNVPLTTLRNWAEKLGLKQEQKKSIVRITKEQFEKIYRLDVPEKEKYEMLRLKPKQYYKKLLDYGYIAKRTAKEKQISMISKEVFEEVFFDNTLTEQEKHKKLGLSNHTYLKKVKEFGLRTDKKENDERKRYE